MTIRKTMLAALVLTLPAAGASAQQEPWTLDRCIEYAVENNISIQQFRLRAEDQDVKLNTARNSRLPNLNAGLGGRFGFGRTLGDSNTYKNVNQFTSSLSVSTSIPLFNGMRIKHDIAAQKLSLQAAMQDLARAREDVSLNVTALYLQALLNKELVRVAESQVALSMAQVERSRLLVESGKSPESELYESRALLAKDSLTLTQARNTLTLSLLDLSQALNREDATGFDIRMPELGAIQIGAMSSMESPSVIYEYAVGNRPSVQAEKYRLQNSEKNLLLARSARYPQISLGASYGTSYFYMFGNENKVLNAGFGNQFRNHGSEEVGLNVSIPIFNRMATRNNIRSARIAIRNQELALTEAGRRFAKEIEQSYYNAGAAYQKYLSASRSLEAPGKPSATRRRSPPPAARRSSTTTMPKHAWSGRSRNWCKPSSNSSFAARFSTFTRANLWASRNIDGNSLSDRCRRNRNLIAYRKGYGLRRLFGKCGIDFDEDRTTTD